MAAIAHSAPKTLPGILDNSPSLAALERTKSLVLRAWILAGVFFMALPGTLLGFSNLMAISAHHGATGLPSAWMEGHGHAQVFGWIGSFILGIGFYSQPTRGPLYQPFFRFIELQRDVADQDRHKIARLPSVCSCGSVRRRVRGRTIQSSPTGLKQ